MKLKAFENRAYNIFFHLHTISGIIISAALFIIFLAGGFTLFKSEIYLWENPKARTIKVEKPDLKQIIKQIKKNYPDFDFNDDTYINLAQNHTPIIQIYGHLKPKGSIEEIHFQASMNPQDYTFHEKTESTVGETLYNLHFFAQIPFIGRWIAGFVSLFFLLAIVTGLLIHWKNILTKFWAFTFKGTWKKIWTNNHTVLGLLGLPFQFMYALTGAFYLLLLIVLLPTVMFFYEGKPEKVYALAYPMYGIEYNEHASNKENLDNLVKIHKEVTQNYSQKYNILGIQTHHVDKEDGAVNFRLVSKDKSLFASNGYIGYRLKDGTEIYNALPGKNKKFTYAFVESIMHLHFGTFGGMFLKGIYFILSLLSCFVFISGILIWKEARNNNKYTNKQKKFHHQMTIIFLAICFSLLPAIGILFSSELIIPHSENHTFWVNTTFFVSWLILSLISICYNTERKITQFNLINTAVIALLIPIINGSTTEDWILSTDLNHVLGVDLFWILIGLISLLTIYKSNERNIFQNKNFSKEDNF